jgi:lactobin A/cerein 7B family class IIb bacteriocin
MRELTSSELEAVSGGLSNYEAAVLTIGLMALGASSPIVIGVGVAALIYYAWC